jgi:hypothetical protein
MEARAILPQEATIEKRNGPAHMQEIRVLDNLGMVTARSRLGLAAHQPTREDEEEERRRWSKTSSLVFSTCGYK